jgi:hypothetical protein
VCCSSPLRRQAALLTRCVVQLVEGDDAHGQDVSPTNADQSVPLLAAIPQGVLTGDAPLGNGAGAFRLHGG